MIYGGIVGVLVDFAGRRLASAEMTTIFAGS
jgi:hypothetical protein